MNTRVHFVATLIKDPYRDDEIAMHHHMVGGDENTIRQLRHTGANWRFTSWAKDVLNWPMVDLWARIPIDTRYDDRIKVAKQLRGETSPEYSYSGAVGW
jgi:hypothetical protein